jgi:hypothetical protein
MVARYPDEIGIVRASNRACRSDIDGRGLWQETGFHIHELATHFRLLDQGLVGAAFVVAIFAERQEAAVVAIGQGGREARLIRRALLLLLC